VSRFERGDIVRATHRDGTVLEGLAFKGTKWDNEAFGVDETTRVELHFSSPLVSHLESSGFTVEKVGSRFGGDDAVSA
jgi:hypothetical protein